MSLIGLPWAIGPVPIIGTALTAYVYAKMLILKQPTTGGTFAMCLLLAAGVCSISAQQFLDISNIRLYIFIFQIIYAVIAFLLLYILNHINKYNGAAVNTDGELYFDIKIILLNACFLVLIDTAVVFIPYGNQLHCRDGRCYFIESMLGKVNEPFMHLYLFGWISSFFLSCMVARVILILKYRR